MSGIAGVLHVDGRPVGDEVADALAAATPRHASVPLGTWRGAGAALVQATLVTTSEGRGVTGPHQGPSGAVIAFDGRLDNRPELLAACGDHGADASSSDSALALAAHDRFGLAFLDRLVGDYALAIWDPAARELLCARSPVGWRPLVFWRAGDTLGFATEPVTLLRGLGVPPDLDEPAIGEFLCSRFVTGTGTLWRRIERLPPGSALRFSTRGLHTWRWLAGPFGDLTGRSEAEHVERFRGLFDDALVATTRGPGPVAAHLSGGLDSSSIVCRTDDLVDLGVLGRAVEPISVRFPGETCDESEWIAAVEGRRGRPVDDVGGRPFDSASASAWCADTLHLPLRPNTAGTICASVDRVRERGMDVLLTGEGGDDWLTGSHGHWPDLARRGRLLALARDAWGDAPGSSWPSRVRLGLAGGLGPLVSPRRRAGLLRPHLDPDLDPPPWVSPAWAASLGLPTRWAAAAGPPTGLSFAQQRRYLAYDQPRRHVGVDNALAYAARAGVELRHPFHDLRLTRFLMAADGTVLRHRGERKHLLREAMRGTLPEPIRTRRTKAVIVPPIIDAVEARLAERPFADLHSVRLGWSDPAVLERYHAAHLAWRRRRTVAGAPQEPYSAVWNAVALDLWLEHAARI